MSGSVDGPTERDERAGVTPGLDPTARGGDAAASRAFDAVVLAGGRGSRLGGVTKPEVLVGGRALVDHVLDAVAGARRVVLVGPDRVARPGVPTVLEDPPGGGPVAGLAAGVAALDGLGTCDAADVVVVLACDVPRAGRAVAALVDAACAPGVDGARLVAADGSAQPLVAAYRRAALTSALGALPSTHGVSMRRALADLRLADVPDHDDASLDADTWDDVARLRRAPWWHDRDDEPREPAAPAPVTPATPADPADPTAGA